MKILFTIFCAVFLTNVSVAQWTQTSGPEGVSVVSSAVCPSGIMLSDNNGNYYRYSGTTWMKTGKLPTSGLLQSVGDILYVTKDQKLQRSDDFGTSWKELPISGRITGTGSVLYCAMSDTLYISQDGGLSWQKNDTLPMFTEYVVSTGSHVVGVVNGFERKILWSVAGSKVWHDASVPPPVDGAFIVDMIADGTSLYALMISGDVFKSADGGNTWEKAYDSPNDTQEQYAQLAKSGENIWLRSYTGIFEWNDSSWSKRLSGYFAAMSTYADGVTLSNNQGVFRLHKDHDVIEYISTGFKNTSISALTVLGKTTFVTAHSGVFRSTDLGASWQSVLPNVHPSDFASTGTHIFSFAAGEGLFRSADDGITWEIVPTPLDDQWQDGTSIATYGSTLFLVHGKTFGEHGTSRWVDGGVLRSTDNGATWIESSNGLPSTIESYVPVQQIINHDGILYLATVEGFFSSTTGGTSWTSFNQGLEFQNTIKVGTLVKGGNTLYCQYYNNMYQLVGDFWVKLPQPGSNTYFFGAYSGYVMGVGDSLYAIAYTYDSFAAEFTYKTLLFDGSSWSDITSSLPEGVLLNNFTKTSGIMLAGSMGHSVWRSGIPNSVERESELSNGLFYPNPADDVLYLDAKFNSANITITDLLGKKVLEVQGIIGNQINVSSLAAGMYNIHITSEGKTSTSRVVIE